jgi:hypothetical protein
MLRYALDLDHLPDWRADRDLCLCSRCRAPIAAGDWARSEPIYKLGELDYVELSHARCAPEASSGDPGQPDPRRPYYGIERGDRVRWPGSFGEHEALGPAVLDPRGGGVLFRALSPSGARVDVALPGGPGGAPFGPGVLVDPQRRLPADRVPGRLR